MQSSAGTSARVYISTLIDVRKPSTLEPDEVKSPTGIYSDYLTGFIISKFFVRASVNTENIINISLPVYGTVSWSIQRIITWISVLKLFKSLLPAVW